ncbi:hypothetical protein Taro_011400, partial [Colocasia esculenta]|nr:hypothetical protein [Colocasia esculenta]
PAKDLGEEEPAVWADGPAVWGPINRKFGVSTNAPHPRVVREGMRSTKALRPNCNDPESALPVSNQ